MSVFDLSAGESAEIVSVNESGAALKRLASLGVVAGAKVTAVAFSLFKSAVLLSVPPVRVSLRRAVAEKIEVKKCAYV